MRFKVGFSLHPADTRLCMRGRTYESNVTAVFMQRNNRLFTPRGNLHLSRRDRDRAGEQQAEAPRDVCFLHQRNRCVPACLSTLYHPRVSTLNSGLIATRHATCPLGKAHSKGRRGSTGRPFSHVFSMPFPIQMPPRHIHICSSRPPGGRAVPDVRPTQPRGTRGQR